MTTPPEIPLSTYTYQLPDEKIAQHPLSERSHSKLLVYHKQKITHHHFHQVTDYIPEGAALFFNDTKVIPARLHFVKDTGAIIEIFLLEPLTPTPDIAKAMTVTTTCTWKCMIGNLKKWKDDQPLLISIGDITLTATISNRDKQIVSFAWNNNLPFVDLITMAGKIPLPPYIKRNQEELDLQRYQTIYSQHEGAVAAPTAGLHFEGQVISALKAKGISLNYLTLHVSAGTFRPIKTENALDHPMHSEQVIISKENVRCLIDNDQIIAVGTTSMRTLESLYWYGVKLLKGEKTFRIERLFPYEGYANLPDSKTSFKAILNHMEYEGLETLSGTTEIFIFPGYRFMVCKGLITNYHLPGSTLILLVAAFIGEDWKKVYAEALENDYRFLSYGDTSLLFSS